MREKKLQKKIKTGSAAKSHKVYVFYEQLKFLEACCEPADTIDSLPVGTQATNLDETEEENVDGDLEEVNNVCVNAVDEPIVKNKKNNNKRKSTFSKTAHKDDELIELLKVKCMREATPKVDDDADKLFLLSLHDELKSLPANLKSKVKCQMLQLLSNAKSITLPSPATFHPLQYSRPPYEATRRFSSPCHQSANYSGPSSPATFSTTQGSQFDASSHQVISSNSSECALSPEDNNLFLNLA